MSISIPHPITPHLQQGTATAQGLAELQHEEGTSRKKPAPLDKKNPWPHGGVVGAASSQKREDCNPSVLQVCCTQGLLMGDASGSWHLGFGLSTDAP